MKKTIFVVALFIAVTGAGIGACVQHVHEMNNRFSVSLLENANER